MDDDYEDMRVEFTLLPGVDLQLWLELVTIALAVAMAVIGVVVSVR